MTLTRALVEILLSPYPESQSTTGIFDIAAVEGSPSVRLDGSCLVPTESATPTGELIKGSLARASHTSGPYGHRPDCGIGGNGAAPESLTLLPPSPSSRPECHGVEALNTGNGVGDCGKLPPGAEAAGTDAFEHRTITSPLRNEHSPDSQISDRHGDDRFTDNILRALGTERN